MAPGECHEKHEMNCGGEQKKTGRTSAQRLSGCREMEQVEQEAYPVSCCQEIGKNIQEVHGGLCFPQKGSVKKDLSRSFKMYWFPQRMSSLFASHARAIVLTPLSPKSLFCGQENLDARTPRRQGARKKPQEEKAFLSFLCAFAPLRLCVRFFVFGSGLSR